MNGERWRPEAWGAGPWTTLVVLLAAICLCAFSLGMLAYGLAWAAHAVRGVAS